MNYRSTNSEGRFVHFGGALVVGTEFGSGVEINPASSGVAANIMPAGDETNKGVTLAAKGTGTVNLGSATGVVGFVRPTAAVGSTAAAAALGNVGGADGPATQAQFGWLRVLDSSGGAQWLAVWR